MKNLTRIGIFVMYDQHGVVDEYVLYLLQEIRNSLDHLVIVCNGLINNEGRHELSAIADQFYERDNIGYDVAAYKVALNEYIGWDKLKGYDELLLFNSTFFGPFYPFEDIFKRMENDPSDFWGITKHGERLNVKAHIQSYFLLIRKKVFTDPCFHKFWSTRKEALTDVNDVISNFETEFTDYFQKQVFQWGTLVDSSDLDDNNNILNNYNHYGYHSYNLLKKYKMPFLKIKSFLFKDISRSSWEELPMAMKYLQEETTYDIGMIWKHLIRIADMNLLKEHLNINYIIPEFSHHQLSTTFSADNKRAAIIFFVAYESSINVVAEYLSMVSNFYDSYIFTESAAIKDLLNNTFNEKRIKPVPCLLTKSGGEEAGCLAVECADIAKNYSYMCYMHDYELSGNTGSIGQSNLYNSIENLAKTPQYINSVLNLMDSNPYLGLLCPPVPYHANGLEKKRMEWGQGYEYLCHLIEKMELNCQISASRDSFSVSIAFWARTDALKPLFNYCFRHQDFIREKKLKFGIERILIYIAQHRGYYSGTLQSNGYAALYLENIQSLLYRRISQDCEEKYIKYSKILDFAHKHNKLYLYGAGKIAENLLEILNSNNVRIQGYIVSDDHYLVNQKSKLCLPLYTLSDETIDKESGVIIALGIVNTSQVRGHLETLGFKNIRYYQDCKI